MARVTAHVYAVRCPSSNDFIYRVVSEEFHKLEITVYSPFGTTLSFSGPAYMLKPWCTRNSVPYQHSHLYGEVEEQI